MIYKKYTYYCDVQHELAVPTRNYPAGRLAGESGVFHVLLRQSLPVKLGGYFAGISTVLRISARNRAGRLKQKVMGMEFDGGTKKI